MSLLKKTVNNRLPQGLCLCLCLLLWAVPSVCLSWSKSGHRFISSQAFAALDPRAQHYLSLRVEALSRTTAASVTTALTRFDQLSQIPDGVRDLPLQRVFALYDAVVPAALAEFAERNTKPWHFHELEAHASQSSGCQHSSNGILIDVLQRLHMVLYDKAATLSLQQEALVLAFVIHQIEDIHQPLHAMSHRDNGCRSDLGGNKTCAVFKPSGKCQTNLHALWDSGFGLFHDPVWTLMESKSRSFLPRLWAQESARYYSQVYALDKEHYLETAENIAKARISNAVLRSADYLQSYIDFKLKATDKSLK